MKILFAMLAVLALVQCKTTRLPPPGEPVRKDLDERLLKRDEAWERLKEAETDPRVAFSDPDDLKAFDAGYAAGFLDHSRRKPSDPEPHMTSVDAGRRAAFSAGYTAGFAK